MLYRKTVTILITVLLMLCYGVKLEKPITADETVFSSITTIIIGDSYGEMSYGGIRNGVVIDDSARNDGFQNCWTGRLAQKLGLGSTRYENIHSAESRRIIYPFEDCLIYSASGRGFIAGVQDVERDEQGNVTHTYPRTDYGTMVVEVSRYVDPQNIELIIIGGGTNDCKFYDHNRMMSKTAEMLENAHQIYPNAVIVLAQVGWGKYAEGCLPEGYYQTADWEDKIQGRTGYVAADLDAVCDYYLFAFSAGNVGQEAFAGHEDVYFTGKISDPSSPAYGQYDPVHPNYLGEQALADNITEKINQNLPVIRKCFNGHSFGEWVTTAEPTCEQAGIAERECAECHKKEEKEIPPTGHNYGNWEYDGEQLLSHTRICRNDPLHKQTQSCEFSECFSEGNVTVYQCDICGGTHTVTNENQPLPTVNGVIRVSGSDRYETSCKIASLFANSIENTKPDAVILASGKNFADALSGAYLASIKNAPIIITSSEKKESVNRYISSLVSDNGTVYVLGGESAVPKSCYSELSNIGLEIKVLAGENRYLTDLIILEEAGITEDTLLVATGKNYADALSAAATGLPVLLVNNTLSDKQKEFLDEHKGLNMIILGGENAVRKAFDTELAEYGSVRRIAGKNRIETSLMIAEEFFPGAENAVIAYSHNFPDSICGGPLANQIQSPLIITRSADAEITASYCRRNGIISGYVLGGEMVLGDKVVRKLFGLSDDEIISRFD